MNNQYLVVALVLTLTGTEVLADNSTLDAAIGGGLGGAAGAAIGQEIAGREGAMIGAALGGAAGAAASTNDELQHSGPQRKTGYRSLPPPERSNGYFCPPGQAKKGRC